MKGTTMEEALFRVAGGLQKGLSSAERLVKGRSVFAACRGLRPLTKGGLKKE